MVRGSPGPGERRVALGRITGAWGVRGWVRLQSWTEPPEQILEFGTWQATGPGGAAIELQPLRGHRQGRQLVAQLAGVEDRDAAQALAGSELSVRRDEFPPPAAGEYYRADLVGLEVVTLEGQALGRVDHFVETPANPVMVVRGEREHWLPAVPRYLRQVDLDRGRVVVDWDPEL